MINQNDKDVLDAFDKMFKYIPDSNEKKQQIDNGIYDPSIFCDEFTAIVEDAKCYFCKQVCLDGIQCPQGCVIFCKKCLEQKKIIKCECSYTLDIKQIDRYKFNKVLSKVIGHSSIICENCKNFGKLKTKIELSNLKEHLSKCDYSSYQCLRCDKKFLNSKNECIKHSHKCGYSDINCSFCNKTIKAYIKDSHEKKCANEKIECDLCHTITERKNIENHKSSECDYRNEQCTECDEIYIHKDKTKHSKEKCLTRQNEMLRSIIMENPDKYDIPRKTAILLKLDIPMKRQTTMSNFFGNKYSKMFINSSIVKKNEDEDINYILGLFRKKIEQFILLYKMSDDGEMTFHQNCDNKKQTLSLIKIKTGKDLTAEKTLIYGGYAEECWDSLGKAKSDPKSFIFSFTNKSEPLHSVRPYRSIICHSDYGPSFGFSNKKPELWIMNKEGGYNATFAFRDNEMICTGGAKEFDVLEIEVYQIIFE